MFTVIHKQIIALDIKRIDVLAPEIALRALAGQFVMVTPVEDSKAIPMTIVDADERKGSVSLIVHEVGNSTRTLGGISIGKFVFQMVGPLGRPAQIDRHGLVICVATGIGAAQILPICRALKKKGNKVIGIIGAKSKKELMLESQMRVVCDDIFITTNDGSYERKGLASRVLQELMAKYKVNAVYAIGSVEMMLSASELARQKGVPIRVTVNSYMTNGLGICGSCRVRVGGDFRLACVDGPEFDGTQVDFEDLNKREKAFKEKSWPSPKLPAKPQPGGLKTFVKSFWGLAKSKA